MGLLCPNLPFTNCSKEIIGDAVPCRTRFLSLAEIQGYQRERSTKRSQSLLSLSFLFLRILVFELLVLCHKFFSPNTKTICGDFRARVAWRKDDRGANRTPDSVSITAVIMPLHRGPRLLLASWVFDDLYTSRTQEPPFFFTVTITPEATFWHDWFHPGWSQRLGIRPSLCEFSVGIISSLFVAVLTLEAWRSTRLILDTSRYTMFPGAYSFLVSSKWLKFFCWRLACYRYERSWGHLFESFEAFLAFSWPVITVTDACTGRAHIVTRLNSIGAFIKMIKTRYILIHESVFNHLMTLAGQVRWDSPSGSQHPTSHSIWDGQSPSPPRVWLFFI